MKAENYNSDDLVASLEDIWFQVDPVVDRITVKPANAANERYSDVVTLILIFCLLIIHLVIII